MEKILLLFRSTRDTIKAEKTCRAGGIACQAIPVPRHISAECGIGLEIDCSAARQALALLEKEHIAVRTHESG